MDLLGFLVLNLKAVFDPLQCFPHPYPEATNYVRAVHYI